MQHESLDQFLRNGSRDLSNGPVALVFVEDDVEVDGTLRHHLNLGFQTLVAFMPPDFELEPGIADRIHRVNMICAPRMIVFDTINRVINAAPGTWMYYCYNAEYLFYPFCETRTIKEMLAFHSAERRDAMLTYVIDLYASDLNQFPNAVAPAQAMFDRAGYYAHARSDPETMEALDRQLDISGGLRWRFEERIPYERRRIDRIGLFKSGNGLQLGPDHTINVPEYNTYSCPWHHNMTAAICSFRAAKALRLNAGSSYEIPDFRWRESVPFEWNSQQLLDLGFIESGQWF